jgi:nucleoid-associated protein YgaU
MNTQRIRTLGGAALVLVLAGACSPQMAQTQYSPAEQQWEQYLRTNYPEWRAPQTVPPMAGVQAEPSADILPEFVPWDATGAELPPVLDEMPLDAAAGGQTYVVEKGDNLWKIAAKFYGKGSQWKKIYDANLDRIPDPARLRPGTELNIPVDGDLVVPK